MPETMSPREKVAQIIKDKVSGPHFTDPSHFVAMGQDRFAAADAILAALASSGDHAELARLAKAATPGPWHRGHNDNGSPQGEMSVWPDPQMLGGIIARCGWQMPWDGWYEQPAKNAAFIAAANPATVLALLAENAALRAMVENAADGSMGQTDKLLAMHERATEAERKLAEAVGLLRKFHDAWRSGCGWLPSMNALDDEITAFLSKEAERG